MIDNGLRGVGGSDTLTVHKPGRLRFWLLVAAGLFVCAFIAMVTVQIHDTVAVTGALEPAGGLTRLYARSGGAISNAFVHEGAHVQRGQLLYVVQTSKSSLQNSDVQSSVLKMLAEKQQYLQNKLAIQQQQQLLQQKSFDDQAKRLASQTTALAAQKDALQHESTDLNHLYTTEQGLAKQHVISAVQLSSAMMDYYSSFDASLEAGMRLEDLDNQLEQARSDLAIHKNELQADLMDTRAALADVSQQISQEAADGTEAIISPIDGIVGYAPKGEGETVRGGELVATVVPNTTALVAKIFVPSDSMGRVHVGDSVKIRYASFPYLQYGLFAGRISAIASTPASDQDDTEEGSQGGYAATIVLDEQSPLRNGSHLQLLPGAKLEASIIVGSDSVLVTLFAPAMALRSAVGS